MAAKTCPEKIPVPASTPDISGNFYTRNNTVSIVWSGKQFFDQLLRLLNGAIRTIHLQTYIFAADSTGQGIMGWWEASTLQTGIMMFPETRHGWTQHCMLKERYVEDCLKYAAACVMAVIMERANTRKLLPTPLRPPAPGVKVKIILAGRSDVALVKHAERFLYRWMFRNNVAVYEYQHDVLHAKMALRDGRYMTIGSYNVNNFSAYASVELNLDVRNRPFVQHVRRQLDRIIRNGCREITPQYFRATYRFPERCWQRCAYEIVKVLLYVFTFYLRQSRLSR